jgi:hypothetical protein
LVQRVEVQSVAMVAVAPEFNPQPVRQIQDLVAVVVAGATQVRTHFAQEQLALVEK